MVAVLFFHLIGLLEIPLRMSNSLTNDPHINGKV